MDHFIGGMDEILDGEPLLGTMEEGSQLQYEGAVYVSQAEGGAPAPPTHEQKQRDLATYKLTIFLTFFGSLCTYPGIISMVSPARHDGLRLNGRLLVDLCNCVFGGCDFVGRIAAAYFPKCSPRTLYLASIARFLLTPALLFCNIQPPSGRWAAPHWFAGSDAGILVLLAVSAGSNGFIFSSCAAAGPGCAEPHERGAVATALVARIFAGNTAGTLMSVLLSFLLGR